MTKHVHAELMLQYAQDAMETDKPWERWEWKGVNGTGWIEGSAHPSWNSGTSYRRKRKTKIVNGFEVYVGLLTQEELNSDCELYVSDPTKRIFYFKVELAVYDILTNLIGRGLVFDNAEDAIAMGKAMIGIDPNG